MNNNLYVIGPKTVFEEKYDEYIAKGFENKGAVRYSLDDTKVLVEEAPEMFTEEDLAVAEFSGNQEEVLVYLADNKAEWEAEELIEE